MWTTFWEWLKDFADPKALAEDRFHAFLFSVVLLGLWRWIVKWKADRKRAVASGALAVVAIFFVVSLLAGFSQNKPRGPDRPNLRCQITAAP
jgi:hypothetical protein